MIHNKNDSILLKIYEYLKERKVQLLQKIIRVKCKWLFKKAKTTQV